MSQFLEKLIYSARWILAPVYIGLSLALLALGLKFFQEAFHMIAHLFTMTEADMVLIILSLIDLALVGGLIVMVMLSGYENFVEQLELAKQEGRRLNWLGTMDASSLKMKVAASIVAISSIHLLKVFMNAQNIPNDKLLWYVVLHLVFVASAAIMSLVDHITRKTHL